MTETAPPPEQRLQPPHAEGLDVVKRALVGTPMPSHAMEETLLRKTLALPIFASDALSSVAYATEAALIVLIGTSLASAYLIVPVAAAVSLLLAIVVLSYRQTVRAYSTSGGSYVVSRDNLGTIPSLVAGAALLTDYVLTVAVSVAAGVLAIVSAVPALDHLTVELSIGAVVLITLVNLRGVRESGVAFAIPTYAFILAMLALVLTGAARCTVGTCPTAVAPDQLPVGAGAITLFALLRAFASGSSALTGVEAISNGVSAFRHPQARNAARTLGILAVIAISLFMGVSWLAYEMHALPSGSASVVSQIARANVPKRIDVRLHVLGRPDHDVRDPDPGREHVVPGVPAACGIARPRPLLPAAIREPRRPARLLERDRGPLGARGLPALGLRRRRRLAYPPLRDRRLHRVHALAGGNGAVLECATDPGMEAKRSGQRRRRRLDRRRHGDRRADEVHTGCLARDRRDPAARAHVPRDPSPLPADVAPAPSRRRRDQSLDGARVDDPDRSRRDR